MSNHLFSKFDKPGQ